MPEVNTEAIPQRFKNRDKWLLWDASADTPRRPHWRGEFSISWNDPDDWHSFEEAVEAASERDSWGIGYVFTPDDDEYIIDVDGPYGDDGSARDWFPGIERFVDADAYVEWSPSDGLHIPIEGRPPEWWSDCEVAPDLHQGVDVLENKFCTFTGDRLEEAGSEVMDGNAGAFLFNSYVAIEEEPPALDRTSSNGGDRDDWLDDDAVEAALNELDPDMHHTEWVRIGYAVHDYDDGSRGKSLFTDWSRQGSKWDEDAKRSVESIWSDADQGSGITVGTLVHKAKEAGWNPSEYGKATATTDGGATTTTTPNDPAPPTPSEDTDDAIDAGRMNVTLCPAEVAAWAGLGEDDDVGDLLDREKAASVYELLQHDDDIHVRVRRDTGEIWAYDDGIWKPEGERALRHAARLALGSMNYGSNVLTELKAQARGDRSIEVNPDVLGLEPGYVAVENGLLDLQAAANGEDDAIRDLRPDDYALARLPVKYDPQATYDEWGDYVDEWAEDGRADALQEYVGYCLHRSELPIHRALLLVGSGANGKGTFLTVVRSLLGRDNTTSIELQTLANERDALAEFEGAIANIDDDLSARKLGQGLGMFKKLSAGDRVRGRRLYEEGFEFYPTGKHLYAANEVPDVNVPDDDEAFWRRWLLVEFPNHYPPSERDPMLSKKLTESDALSGVLNWAIEGWDRLLDEGYFTNEKRYAHEKRERWQAWGDSIDKFIETCVERDPEADNVATGDVHRIYAKWCREHGEKPASQQKLTSELKNGDFDYGQSVRPGGTGTPTRGFKALAFTDEAPDLDETPDRGTGQQQLG